MVVNKQRMEPRNIRRRRTGRRSPGKISSPDAETRGVRGLRTRKKILETAMSLIAARGLGGATFDAIAEAAKLSPSLPVFHYKNKKALFTALLQDLTALYTASWAASLNRPGLSAKERLERIISHDIAFAEKYPKEIAVWFAFWGDRNGRELYRAVSRRGDESYLQVMREAVEQLRQEGEYKTIDSDAVAISIYLQIFGFWLWDCLSAGRSAASQIERSLAFLLASSFPRHYR
jgi:TetR/AcrR family transcriptional regulator, transcriptional repressor of bet genes